MEVRVIPKSKSHKYHLALFRLEHLRKLTAQVCETPVDSCEKISLPQAANTHLYMCTHSGTYNLEIFQIIFCSLSHYSNIMNHRASGHFLSDKYTCCLVPLFINYFVSIVVLVLLCYPSKY